MDAARLTSNHVNYLIWRYLQESGHGEAAVKLQRDWLQDPQSLPYAQETKTHALVRLVQKGIQYYEIEKSISQSGTHFLPPSFLDPDAGRAKSSPKVDASQDESTTGRSRASPRSRKHGREPSTINGLNLELPASTPAVKRNRRSNGTATNSNTGHATLNGEPRDHDTMDLDDRQHNNASPEQPQFPVGPLADHGQTAAEGASMDVDDDAPEPDDPRMILTNGPSVGVQSDRVTELGPETSVLRVPQRNVLHTAWSPTDPLLLAVAGDALCRIWTVTKPGSDAPQTRPSPDYHYVDILEQGDDSSVTAMSWSPDGEILALATRPDNADQAGEVSLWSKHGKSRDNLTATQDMLITFKWNPSGTHLLGITSSGTGTSALTVWNIQSSQAIPALHLDQIATDAVWYDDQKFLVCGHSLVAECFVDPYNNVSVQNHAVPESDHNRNWTYARYDPATQTAALAAEDSAALAVLGLNGQYLTTIAHDAEITDVAFEPSPKSPLPLPPSPRRLATSSLDGNVCIWDTLTLSMLHSLHFAHSSPAMAIRFTPDGYLLAAANGNRVLYWTAATGGMPKAVWHGDISPALSGTGFSNRGEDRNGGVFMDGDSGIGEEDETATHSLSWDVDGRRLAYGLGSQISIIGLRPQPKQEALSNPPTPAPS
ncbi:MAG: hypothetical protein Q9168_001188 [Polycauliona sp. 1 TL-2023]